MSEPGWWLLLPDDVDLVEEEDGTFTLATPLALPPTDLDPDQLVAVIAGLRRLGYTVTAPT